MFTNEQFTQYAKRYMDTVFRVGYSDMKTCVDADDITQNVLIKLYHANKDFESDANRKHWLIRVTINECKKAFLSPWRRSESIGDYADTLTVASTEHSELFYAVMDLPKKYRVAVFLYYYEDYSTEEIAQLCGKPKASESPPLSFRRLPLQQPLWRLAALEDGFSVSFVDSPARN